MKTGISFALLLLAGCAQMAPQEGLGGTSWQLVKFQGGDGTVLTPDEKAKYTVAFGADGKMNVRFDCNRGFGGWNSPEKGRLEFGPMGMTRAMCPPESLHDHLVRQWPQVRSYVIKGGRLYLSLMADGGIYEFERLKSM
jgi:para-nitrobenzyl esterase